MSRLDHTNIPDKANRILNIILAAFVLIALRVWHLTTFEYDEKFEASKRPQLKVDAHPAPRASIRDRFNIPMAVNTLAYRAGVIYTPIRSIPSVEWVMTDEGKKKVFKRKNYIKELSLLLEEHLGVEASRAEDLIHSKAALYSHVPYLMKEDLDEDTYYQLKMLEKQWPGLYVESYTKRDYPKKKVGCDVVGYMGAISREEYESRMREKLAIEKALAAWERGEEAQFPEKTPTYDLARNRLRELLEQAYAVNDQVGKTGVEKMFEEALRGAQGKKSYYSDSKGHPLLKLPGAKDPSPGKRVLLTLSSELQEYAESLLTTNEEIRQARLSTRDKVVQSHKQPWIKGGSIVAMDPRTGEILALATYPRFDPNDFTGVSSDTTHEKAKKVSQWLESDHYVGEVWNEVEPLTRERYDSKKKAFYEESLLLTWEAYLDKLLPENHPITEWFAQKGTLSRVAQVLHAVEAAERESQLTLAQLLRDSKQGSAKEKLEEILHFLPSSYTKLLFVDLCQLAMDPARFSPELIKKMGGQTLQQHKSAASAFYILQKEIKEQSQVVFREEIFKKWRTENEKSFLKEKRAEEKKQKIYPRPYLDYLDKHEKEMFTQFWEQAKHSLTLLLIKGQPFNLQVEGYDVKPFEEHFLKLRLEILEGAHPSAPWRDAFKTLGDASQGLNATQMLAYLKTLRPFQELNRPLKGVYKGLRCKKSVPLEKHLAAAFYPAFGYGYGRSQGFRQAALQGSIFKMVTAYEALCQTNKEEIEKGRPLTHKNPLFLDDEIFKNGNQTFLGRTSAGKPIPQLYKGGRIPRSGSNKLGKMDLLRAIETSSNLYFSMLASDVLEDSEDLAKAARKFGYGEKTGISLPGEIPGKVPEDLSTNPTGLFATAIGQHTLVVTPLQTACMLAALVNGGLLLEPKIIKAFASSHSSSSEISKKELTCEEKTTGLAAIGLAFSPSKLFENETGETLQRMPVKVRRKIPMTTSLRNLLLEGMNKVVQRTHASSLWSLSRIYSKHPEAISDYVDMKHQLIGKTSTAESIERVDFDEELGAGLYKHVWFGGVAFESDVTPSFSDPELVVVVYLRFGTTGKEAAPLAAQIAAKWKEIKSRHGPK